MSSLDQAFATQIANIQTKTGKSLDELRAIIEQSGLTKHAELRTMLQRDLGLGYGDANALVHAVRNSDGQRAAAAAGATSDDVVDALYTGARAALRPIHNRLITFDTQAAFEELCCRIVEERKLRIDDHMKRNR